MSQTSSKPIAVIVTDESEYMEMNSVYEDICGKYASENEYPGHPVYFLMDFRGLSLEDPNITPDEYEYQIITLQEFLS